MPYSPSQLSIGNWASPINIVGSDKVINLDEAVNQIITSDPASLVTHVNTELAKLPNYLSTELSSIAAYAIAATDAAAAAALASQNAAATSESNAAASASSASTSATSAGNSATAAANSATSAAGSATTATTKANEAATSATSAAGSANTATTKAGEASASATAAAGSATSASTSEGNAASSATAAQLRAWEAEAEKMTSNSYANEAVDTEVKHYTSDGDGTFTATPQTGIYSALHHQTKGLAQDASLKVNRAGDTMTGNLEAPSMSIGGDFLSVHSLKNKLINGGFDVWQRGTSFNGLGDKYCADRWIMYDGSGDNMGVIKSAVAHPTAKYGLRVAPTTAGASNYSIVQMIEDSKSLNGKTVTFSIDLYVSGVSNQVKIKIVKILKTNPLINGYTNIITIGEKTVTPAATWSNRFSVTADIPSATTDDYYYGVEVQYLTPSVGDLLYMTNAQLEYGNVATPFEQRPIGLEEMLCKIYYEQFVQAFPAVADDQWLCFGFVKKRVTPSLGTLDWAGMILSRDNLLCRRSTGSYQQTIILDSEL